MAAKSGMGAGWGSGCGVSFALSSIRESRRFAVVTQTVTWCPGTLPFLRLFSSLAMVALSSCMALSAICCGIKSSSLWISAIFRLAIVLRVEIPAETNKKSPGFKPRERFLGFLAPFSHIRISKPARGVPKEANKHKNNCGESGSHRFVCIVKPCRNVVKEACLWKTIEEVNNERHL